MIQAFKASNLHPGSWWILALCLASSAAFATNSLALVTISLSSIAIILLCREGAPWSQSLRFYLFTGLAVIVIRVVFRIIFNLDSTAPAVLSFPVLRIDLPALGEVQLFGRVGTTALASALRDGLRLAAIILSIGMANSLANPRRLLKNTPGALYEVATAFVIAINLAPQLVSSAHRVKQARTLRRNGRKVRWLDGILIPVLSDTLDRSIALAASMDARGFGRRGNLSTAQIHMARAGSLAAVSMFGIGSYLLLTSTDLFVTFGCFAIGVVGLFVAVRVTSTAHIKTRHRPDKWRKNDGAVIGLGLLILAVALSGAIR